MNFDSLRDQVSNLTLYDLKAGIRKVQNTVMNYTEMESKVREATNNEPWGASSTMMQDIANGTFNFQLLSEIMPMVYKRFTEKSAEEWRQIYKALQLLEFLIKNGSERVIDDARSHLSLLKMLRQFHYIDPNGKDQGLNVRNRSKELTDLLSDVDRIRQERKKARSSKNKYSGVEGGQGLGAGAPTTSKYGGFGSEEQGGYGAYSGGVYGDGGGFGGQTTEYDEERSQSRGRERFEEYDEYDEGAVAPPGRRKADAPKTAPSARGRASKKAAEVPKPKAKEPEVDLFSFGDDDVLATDPIPMSDGKQPATAATSAYGALQSAPADEDDFDDFQSATPSTQAPSQPTQFIPLPTSTSTTTTSTQFAAPQARPAAQAANYSNLFATTSPAPSQPSAFTSPVQQQQQYQLPKPTGYQAAQPNYFTSVSVQPAQPQTGVKSPSVTAAPAGKPKSAAGGDAFAALLGGTKLKSNTPTGKGPTIQDMARQKASAGLWGTAGTTASASSTPPAGGQRTGGGGALDDLLG